MDAFLATLSDTQVRRVLAQKLKEEYFSAAGIEFAHRNVTFYLPEDKTQEGSEDKQAEGAASPVVPDRKLVGEAGAAAAIAAIQAEEEAKKPKV
ncbi:MAG: hypothetical protein JSV31_09745 [Desulfobacterales bacterium]|nr:MAG: hypothetical protein JSV31_09745 [Desulfobacterales bacterium]